MDNTDYDLKTVIWNINYLKKKIKTNYVDNVLNDLKHTLFLALF